MKGSAVCSFVVLLSAVSCSLAAVGLGRATVHESHPGKCYNEKSNSYFSPGESWPMDQTCGKVTCEKTSSSSAQLMTSFVTCGVAMTAPPCYMVQDMSKPYPQCCKQVVCPESNNDSDEQFAVSEEDIFTPGNNDTAPASPSSSENNLVGTAMHFSLGRKEGNVVDNVERNDLQSLEEEEPTSEEESFEIVQPRLLPPRFQFASLDDIEKFRQQYHQQQRFNEVDAQQEDYQLV